MGHGMDEALPEIDKSLENIQLLDLGEVQHLGNKSMYLSIVNLHKLLGRVSAVVA